MKKVLYAVLLIVSNVFWFIMYMNERDIANCEERWYRGESTENDKRLHLIGKWFDEGKIGKRMLDEYCECGREYTPIMKAED